jgi:asparagine synthase (glutamine-hydrolysing)
MCGIAGFYAADQHLGPWFAEATLQARHRGPDGDGCWMPGWEDRRSLDALRDPLAEPTTVALGFVRLAILDLGATGEQPMVAPGGEALAFNGEIYNYVELRRELAAHGATFRSTGDTEVLLNGWRAWGFDLLPRLNGMWAFALYDARRRGLLLCRDRFGEKPLFWTAWRGGIAFASEIKQLAGFPGVELRLDVERAAAYLATGRPYDGASSWFEGIHQLEPASWLWIDADGRRTGRYFDLEEAVRDVDVPAAPSVLVDRFADELRESVRIRLRSDVPVGTSLSGGIDSSAVMAEATALGHRGYHSFTLGSDDPSVDESREAQAFAQTMGSTWHGVTADGDEFAALWDRLSWHQECPVPSTSLYGQWKVLAEARRTNVIVLLDGQGADEVLGGYHKFYAALVWEAVRARSVRAVPLLLGFGRQVGGLRTVTTHGHRYLGRLSRGLRPSQYLEPGLDGHESSPALRVDPLTMRLEDIRRWSLPNLLSYVDRNAMAHSVETRLPFLDPRLAALALAMPPDLLVHDGWTKWPVRRALSARGGAEPAWRRGKRWFGAPQAAWIRGSLRDHVDAFRRDPHPAWAEIADPHGLRRLLGAWADRRPSPAWDDRVFQMVALERFLRVWLPAQESGTTTR